MLAASDAFAFLHSIQQLFSMVQRHKKSVLIANDDGKVEGGEDTRSGVHVIVVARVAAKPYQVMSLLFVRSVFSRRVASTHDSISSTTPTRA